MGLGIKSKVNGLVAQAATKIGISWGLGVIRGAAREEYGPVWKARYDMASEAAPWTGFGLALVTIALTGSGSSDLVPYVGTVAGVLISAGFVNAAYLTEIPLGLKYNAVYQKLVSWAPTTTILLGALWTALEASTDPQVAKWRMPVLIADLLAAKLGLVSAALDAKPPKPTLPGPGA